MVEQFLGDDGGLFVGTYQPVGPGVNLPEEAWGKEDMPRMEQIESKDLKGCLTESYSRKQPRHIQVHVSELTPPRRQCLSLLMR